ncbi:MAG: hypothetical protein FD153_181 [Rhodospirillaceae bacterium]|nr:MAG: hypothetical protein FD153_181 [Rhodospirillaceae bacterium]
MRVVFIAKVPKLALEPGLMEDAAAARHYRGLYAVSDGASESYGSAAWARTLVTRFVNNPGVGATWVTAAIKEYNSRFNREAMSWSAQAAFDRGSFATLLGVRISGDRARVLGVGDSLAVLVSDGRLTASFPYRDAEQFKAHPVLLSTVPEKNAALLVPGTTKRLTTNWSLKGLKAPTILMMTDALGAWLLADPDIRLQCLLSLPSRTAFAALVDNERAAETMRRDDSTLLRLE